MSLLWQTFRDTNSRLQLWLDEIGAPCGQPVVVTPENMAALLSELLRTGEALRAAPDSARGNDPALNDPVLKAELATYRRHVERLRDLMPSIRRHLVAERNHIEVQRARLQSAAQWSRASRQTLWNGLYLR